MSTSEIGHAIRVIIVDDHSLVAETLAEMFKDKDGFELLGTAGTVAEAATLAKNSSPDVAIIDYHLPDGDGISLAKIIARDNPNIKLLMLTGSAERRVFGDAVDIGFTGFITKDMAVDDLLSAVRTVHSGGAHMPPDLLGTLLPRMKKGYKSIGGDLTEREREILIQLSNGNTTSQIADKLFLSLHTVRNHIQNILMKLQAHSQLEAVSIAIRERIIETP